MYKNSKEQFNTKTLNYFDKFLIINLKKDKERYTQIYNSLLENGINRSKIVRIDAKYEKFNGHLGCGKSHAKALEYAIDNNLENVVIMEDDFNFIKDINLVQKKITQFIDNFPNWDYVDFYFSHYGKLTPTNIDGIIRNEGPTTGCVGYAVNKKFYDILLKNRKEAIQKMQDSTDKYLEKCKKENNCKRIMEQSYIAIDQYQAKLQKEYNWYCFKPKLGIIRDVVSTIMSEKYINYRYSIYV